MIAAQQHPHLRRCSLARLCSVVGLSRQSHYAWRNASDGAAIQEKEILDEVQALRRQMPELGGRKLHVLLSTACPALMCGIGRDALFRILRAHGLLIVPTKRFVRTTFSQRWRTPYPNLLRDRTADYPGHIIVSDITYLRLADRFVFLSLVTDLYSRTILGYHLSTQLTADGPLEALRMALRSVRLGRELIHHSDHGLQYYCAAYRRLIENDYSGCMSGTGEGGVYENAVAERVNGILKTEFHLYRTFSTFAEAEMAVAEAVRIYNTLRPHTSIGMLTPEAKFAA
jgi:transposase InsO family protein